LNRFNLSSWALEHRSLVLFFMLAFGVIGVLSYRELGQSEDPPFTFKVMIVRTLWPGATAREVEQQVTDRIEKKLQETPHLDYLRSFSKPGESQIFVLLKDSTPSSAVPDAFYQVRKKVSDIAYTLPAGVRGPFFNDEFGVTLGNLYALTGDGFDYAKMKEYADRIRLELLRVPDVSKVEIIGEQDQKIYVEISNAKVATTGIDLQTILNVLQQQNAMTPAGSYEGVTDRVYLRATGGFDSVEQVRDITFRANDRVFKLGDFARVYRGYEDPPAPKTRYMGKESLAIGVSMADGGDIVELGRNLDRQLAQIKAQLPVGLEIAQVSSMPRSVTRSVNEFVRTLAEAIVIVLAVSFFSLGWRTGLVVACSIPLVLAMTFLCMNLFGIGLHKISLGALILALGLLVDDAIIAVEMMARRMEQGHPRIAAASFAYQTTAFPMLSGTLVTAAGFIPIAIAQSSTGEYTRSIFQVTVIALLISWVAAVIFIPYLGYRMLPDPKPHEGGHHDEEHVYRGRLYQGFRRLVEWCVTWRKTVIGITAGAFVLSIVGFGLVQQQFFPDSTRPELLIDLTLPHSASFAATEAEVTRLEGVLAKEKGIENYISYVGTGSPRFYFPLDQQLPNVNFAEFVVTTRGFEEREVLRSHLIALFDRDFPGVRANIKRLENGPPVGFPVQYRVSGPDPATVRAVANKVASAMRKNRDLTNVQFDWDELSKVVHLHIDQDKARLLGVSSQEIATFLNSAFNGIVPTAYRERDQLIDVVLRGPQEERARLSNIDELAVPTRAGRTVPLGQIVTVSYGLEEGMIWRRNRLPTITVSANIYGGRQAPDVTGEVEPTIAPIRAALPIGYAVDTGGAVEESAKGGQSVARGVPVFLFTVLTVLMLQLQSFSRMAMVVLTAPLGLIGVTLFLLVSHVPFGFVAMLGTIALSGMIMRNSVILVDQIEQDIAAGHPAWTAIVDATVRRCRPIVLTAAAAILAMIPLIVESDFFRPMAVAIMGGLFVATLLTLLFLPALYAAWFRVKPAA